MTAINANRIYTSGICGRRTRTYPRRSGVNVASRARARRGGPARASAPVLKSTVARVSYQSTGVRGIGVGRQTGRSIEGIGTVPSFKAGEETTVTNYLIAFNDEWVPEHTSEELHAKSVSSMAVIEEMKAAGVFLFGDGGIDASTAVCSIEAKDGEP